MMGDVVRFQPNQLTDEELTLQFIVDFRSSVGLPQLAEPPETLRDGLGDGLKMYRYAAPGKQFAITADTRVRDALHAAGAGAAVPFRMTRDGKECWDISLPSFLWEFM